MFFLNHGAPFRQGFHDCNFFEEIYLNLELADSFVELLTLILVILFSFPGLIAFREHVGCLFQKLPLPLGYLVRVDLVFLGEFCQGKSLTEGFKDYPGFEFRREFPAGSFHDDCCF